MFINLHRKQLIRCHHDIFQPMLSRRIPASIVSSAGKFRYPMANVKPPNILVYSETPSVKHELIGNLRSALEPDCYTVYSVTKAQIEANAWPDSTVLLVVHGSVESTVTKVFLDYFLKGGKLLSICSDLLELIISKCKETRGIELVTVTYETWQNIQVMQEIRPLNQNEWHFEEHLRDLRNNQHRVDVKVLAVDEAFKTPSILTAACSQTNGQAVLTQIVLTNSKEDKLKSDLLRHILGSLLGIKMKTSQDTEIIEYKNAFLLGTEESKLRLLNSLDIPNQHNANNLSLHFQTTADHALIPSGTLLPVLTETLPDNFEYSEFQHYLKTTHLGRPVIYAPIITTCMKIINNTTLSHGFAVLPRRQTNGSGRSNNQWLSPDGCAMFALQLHVPLGSTLGQRLPMIQHLVAIGVVSAVKSVAGCSELDIGLKWPNDIYAGGRTKIGGVIVNSQLQSSQAVVNIGCGVNLSNSRPTMCINDLISKLDKNLPPLGIERMLALVFNEIERIYDLVQQGDIQMLSELYYRYWLHGGKRVTMKNEDGLEIGGKIVGVDEYGYLLVEPDGAKKPICVLPDGNSFDMMKGLIIPKYC